MHEADIKNYDVSYGKELILNTSKYFGPKGSISQNSNGMNCTNCHLDGGSRDFGNNFKAVSLSLLLLKSTNSNRIYSL